MAFSTLILAAGAGTRMKSERPKVAHELLNKPLIRWVVDAAKAAGAAEVITVVGHLSEQVAPLVSDTTVVLQSEQLGTGHAVQIAAPLLGGAGAEAGASAGTGSNADTQAQASADKAIDAENSVAQSPPSSLVVLCGDTPLIRADTISALVASQQQSQAAICVLSHMLDDSTNYGRIVRDAHGAVTAIVEEKDASPAQRQIKECNSGAYCFDLPTLLESLSGLSANNAQGEYYLTDVIGICVQKGLKVVAHVVDATETQGINNRAQLAAAGKDMQRRINETHMLAGVTMTDPNMVWIGPDVKLESDIELLPLTMIYGDTQVQSGSVIGPNTRIIDSQIGPNCHVDESVVLSSTLEAEVSVGPRAYLRPGTVMQRGSKAGTHVEIKNSTIGPNSKVPHLSYFGDAILGSDVNIGAGSITCNYNGAVKNTTTVGDRAFVGSDTMLVAPVTIGADVTTGAGSVITKDVPDGALAVERTAQNIIKGWTYDHKKEKP